MFSVPVVIAVRTDERVFKLHSSVDIDKIESVNPLDRDTNVDVGLDLLYDYMPLSEIVLTDGRRLPVCEPASLLELYLEAYRQIEEFYNADSVKLDPSEDRGVVIPLFPKARPCASSEGSTPD